MAYKRISPQPVVEGGTGAQTLTGVLTGNGTSAITANTVTQFGTVVAGASNAVSSIAPSATVGIPYVSQGAASNPAFSTAVVAGGGTGNTTFTPYAVITAGTTATGPFQNVVGVGTSGQVLTSAGAAALPAWQTLAGSSITITGDTGGPLTSGSFTFTGGTTGLSFGGAGTTQTLTFAGITANGGTVSLATDATASTINIGTGAGAKTVTLGSTNTTSTTNLQAGSGGIKIPAFAEGALVTSSTGVISTVTGTANFVLTANAAGTAPSFKVLPSSSITITGDTGGGLTGNSFTFTGGTTGLSFGGAGSTETLTFAGITANGGTVSLATDATTSTINVGTGAGVKTSTFGSTNSTSATTVQSGSGALNVTSTNGALTINSGTGALGISTDASATTVSFATGAAVKGVTLGSTNSTSATTVQSGSGALNVTSTNGALTINSGTGALGVSTDASATTVSFATGAAVKGVTLGSTNSTSATTVQSGSGALNVTSTNGALTINSGTGTLAVSNDASATTVNLGTGAAAKTVTLGSTNTTSTTTLQAGSGGVKLGSVAEGALVTSSTSVISTVTGTAGFVLTANAAGTAPSFQAAGGGGILSINVTLTSAQIKSLHATPIQLIAAPSAGQMIAIVQAVYTFHYGGSNVFVAGASQSIAIYYGTTTQGGVAVATAPLVGTSTVLAANNGFNTATISTTSFAGFALNAYNPIATEISGNAANDNTVTINILYVIITL